MAADETKEPAKKRAKRRQSDYIVLRKKMRPEGIDQGDPFVYEHAFDGPSVKACLKAIAEQKIVGELLIVCVRRRLTSEVQETIKFT